MQKEKGQIEIILLILLILGVVLFLYFTRGNSQTTPSAAPDSQGKTSVSPGQESLPATPPDITIGSIPDVTPPYRFDPQPNGSLFSGTRQTLISLKTDENATCRYSTVSGFFYEYIPYTFSETGGVTHSALITALSEGEVYNYYVRCIDGQGNKNSNDFIIVFYIEKPQDYIPPVISNPYPRGDVLPSVTTQTMIGVSTNESASCRYSLAQGTLYNSMTGSLSLDETQKYHTTTIKNLRSGQSYEYFVRCKDSAGNVNDGDVMISFQVAP